MSPDLTGDPHGWLVRDPSGTISGVSEGKVSGGLHDVFQFPYLAARSDDKLRDLPLMSVKFDVDAGSEVVSFGTQN